ncbi:MerR family transcriptional regulator [Lutimaribacter marinistellae]|uniref:MerR family transcriptional regulator n=1 Tax=Lutimaribacter marinistellae TaxID=1820329 RepID=A0ABV7TKR2_9RHOB
MTKSPDAFRTISEVAEWLGVQAHVLRFWESKFAQVKPVKRAGGRRYYRPNDMLLLGGIKKLLHDDGLTIKGVQKILREKGPSHVADLSQGLEEKSEPAFTEGGTVVRFQGRSQESEGAQIDLDFGDMTEPDRVEALTAPQAAEKAKLPSFLSPPPDVEAVADAENPALNADEVEHEALDEAIEPAPGPLAALAGIDRLTASEKEQIVPLAQALRTWLERYDAEAAG